MDRLYLRSPSVSEAAPSAVGRPIKVSELTRYLKYVVETDELLKALSVEGELSEFSRSPAGHVYFTLKDAASQVSCVLFRREAAQQELDASQLQRGVAVVVHGFLTVYEPRGSYQIYVERLVVRGQGALARRFERLRTKLEEEGLFAVDRKRPVPPYPRRIALITSPGSQAYHDVLHRLSHQYPCATVIVAGTSVQGDGSGDEMALALDIINRLTDADIILLVRGGGSPEDLAAFNEERLARAIFASRIPVVTGIGHETDYTIADFVADLRAATPSLAAAMGVPDLRAVGQRAAQLHAELAHAIQQRLRLERKRWIEVNRALLRGSPENRLKSQRQMADERVRAAQRAIHLNLRAKRARVVAQRAQLRALDPLAILARGYAVLSDPDSGRVVSDVAEATPGRRLQARVSDGTFNVRVGP
jgi:exodeoxyribonuclease VII large subunit